MLLRALVIWLVIAGAEIAQGILRIRFLNRRVGDHRARQIGVLTGSAAIVLIAWLSASWLGATTTTELFGVGLLWLVLMLGLEFFFGRLVFRLPWPRILADFDLRQGRLLALGMVILLLAPFLAAKLRGLALPG